MKKRYLALLVLAALISAATPFGHRRVRAATLLTRFSDEAFDKSDLVTESASEIPSPRGTIRTRLYMPLGAGPKSSLPGVVLVHGVHHKGIDEPRLRKFSRAIAASGVIVMTPEIRELADYRVEPRSVDTVETAARALMSTTGRARVGLMGMSFGGGIVLLAAARPSVAESIAFVVAVGAHNDLERVTRFFVTGGISDPDGAPSGIKPHEYGAMVLAYSRARDLFPEGEREMAEAAMGHWLREEQKEAREKAGLLSEPTRARLEALFTGNYKELERDLLAAIEARREEMKEVSPHEHLRAIHAPVYLLHGAGDSVIPATETRWLARDVPPQWLREALVSSAIVHVSIEGTPAIYDRWQLVDFMGRVLSEADAN